MEELCLNDTVIKAIKKEVAFLVRKLMGDDLVRVILYGSCARGDYSVDSDIDIALITVCDRIEAKRYNEGLAQIATQLAMNYFAIVNFVCLPEAEFLEKRSWYLYFRNIALEGEVLYTRRPFLPYGVRIPRWTT